MGSIALPTHEQAQLARRANRAFLLPWLLVKDDVEGYFGLREQNRRLHTDLQRRSLERSELEWTRLENLRLREALAFRDRQPVRLLGAEILASAGAPFPRSFLIDKGAADGVRPNLPVVTPDGLVGKTAETDRHAALVLTFRHPDFRASALALIGDEAETGIAAATPAGELELHVPMRSVAVPGHAVVTSGIGPVFPRGIPIGTITAVGEEDRLKLQKNDRIAPAVDLNRVTSVFVLMPERTDGGVVADRDAALFWPGAEDALTIAADSLTADSLAAAGPAGGIP